MSALDLISEQAVKIRNCNNGINAITNLLEQFQIDSDCSGEIPDSVNNGCIRGGLLAALSILVDASERSAECIEEAIHRTKEENIPHESEGLR